MRRYIPAHAVPPKLYWEKILFPCSCSSWLRTLMCSREQCPPSEMMSIHSSSNMPALRGLRRLLGEELKPDRWLPQGIWLQCKTKKHADLIFFLNIVQWKRHSLSQGCYIISPEWPLNQLYKVQYVKCHQSLFLNELLFFPAVQH